MAERTKNLHILLDPANRPAFAAHDRTWSNHRYVYAVVSRRSGGISIGVNLNPNKVCNFDCIYCSVDRRIPALPGSDSPVDPALVQTELERMLTLFQSGEIFRLEPFAGIAPELRRLNDVAFSGDGEPTTCPQFPRCCRIAAGVLQRAGMAHVKIVVITNATMFHRPGVREALAFLDARQGEIWAKLDAGTPEYYRMVDRTGISLEKVLANILWCARQRPTVIQTLLLRVRGEPPPESEITAYIRRLGDILREGGRIKLVQLYTVARRPAEAYAAALAPEQLLAVAARLRDELPSLAVEVYP